VLHNHGLMFGQSFSVFAVCFVELLTKCFAFFCSLSVQSQFEDVEKINTESEDFASLPAEIKHEILSDLKDIRRRTFWAKSDEMPAVCVKLTY